MRISNSLLLFLGSWIFGLLVTGSIFFSVLPKISAQVPCVGNSSNSKVTGGIITSPDFDTGSQQNFQSNLGCIDQNSTYIDLNQAYTKLGTFDDIFYQYYDRSTLPKVSNFSTLTGVLDKTVYFYDGNYTLDQSPQSANNQSAATLIFIRGDLNIKSNIDFRDTDPKSGLVFVVKGKVNVDPSVTKITGVIIAEDQICSNYQFPDGPCSSNIPRAPDAQLVVHGNFISLNQAIPPKLVRNLRGSGGQSNTQSAELIQTQAKYFVILKDLLTQKLSYQTENTNFAADIQPCTSQFSGCTSVCRDDPGTETRTCPVNTTGDRSQSCLNPISCYACSVTVNGANSCTAQGQSTGSQSFQITYYHLKNRPVSPTTVTFIPDVSNPAITQTINPTSTTFTTSFAQYSGGTHRAEFIIQNQDINSGEQTNCYSPEFTTNIFASCPTTCHSNTISVSNADCGVVSCQSNAPVEDCPTTCHSQDLYVAAGDSCDSTVKHKLCPANSAQFFPRTDCPVSCHGDTSATSGASCEANDVVCPATFVPQQACPTTCHSQDLYVAAGDSCDPNVKHKLCTANTTSFFPSTSCPDNSTCHGPSTANSGNSCTGGDIICPSNYPAAENCPTTCHSNTAYVRNGDSCDPNVKNKVCPGNSLSFYPSTSCPSGCHTATTATSGTLCQSGDVSCLSNTAQYFPPGRCDNSTCHDSYRYNSGTVCAAGDLTCPANYPANDAATVCAGCSTSTRYYHTGSACGATGVCPNNYLAAGSCDTNTCHGAYSYTSNNSCTANNATCPANYLAATSSPPNCRTSSFNFSNGAQCGYSVYATNCGTQCSGNYCYVSSHINEQCVFPANFSFTDTWQDPTTGATTTSISSTFGGYSSAGADGCANYCTTSDLTDGCGDSNTCALDASSSSYTYYWTHIAAWNIDGVNRNVPAIGARCSHYYQMPANYPNWNYNLF